MKSSTSAPVARTRHVVMALQWYSHLNHRGIARYAKEANWSLHASEAHAWDAGLSPLLASALRHADGVIGLFCWPSSPALELIRRLRIPVVDRGNVLPCPTN